MQISITASPRQIRYYVSSAINALTLNLLSPESAKDSAVGHLQRLMVYLDALDSGNDVVVADISAIEAGIRLKAQIAPDGKVFDLISRYLSPPDAELYASQQPLARASDE
jgi:hypothetical protein